MFKRKKSIKNILQNKPLFIDEAIIVDNNSNDGSAKIAKRCGANVIFEKNKGYGYACLSGLAKANGDIIVMMDGDGSYPLYEIIRILKFMEKGNYDFIVGCRYPLTDKYSQPTLNKFANYFISRIIRIFFRIPLTDSQSGMMVLKKEILKRIYLYNTGMGLSQEIKIKAFIDKTLNCSEIKIDYLRRIGKSKFNLFDGIKNFYSALELFIKLVLKNPNTTKLC